VRLQDFYLREGWLLLLVVPETKKRGSIELPDSAVLGQVLVGTIVMSGNHREAAQYAQAVFLRGVETPLEFEDPTSAGYYALVQVQDVLAWHRKLGS
jgi:hypothetical protein